MVFNPAQLQAFLAAYPGVNRYWVGVSGGLDSVVLLHALVSLKLPQPVQVLHVNHSLSPHADSWQAEVQALCRELGVVCTTEKVTVANTGAGVEDAAREARYRVFAGHLQAGDALLLGHHQDDQAETLLYRLLRGSGPQGLAAMATVRALGPGQLLRPLLGTGRAELARYGAEHQLRWVDDESNQDIAFDRNYLRHKVMPTVIERWPQAGQRLAESARWCGEAVELLSERAAEDLAVADSRAEAFGGSLGLAELAALSPARRRNLLRHWLQTLGLTAPGGAHMGQIEDQFFGVATEGELHRREVCWSGCSLRVYQGRLYALAKAASWAPDVNQPILNWPDPHRPLTLPGGDCLSWQQADTGEGLAARWLDKPWQVCWRQGGERSHPMGRAHSQTLKKLLQEYDLPVWLRARVPLLMVDGKLAAVADLWVDEAFCTPPDQPGYRCHWQLAAAPAVDVCAFSD